MYKQYIKNALKAAKYHEDTVFAFENETPQGYDKIIYHLRAYFWELWSVWDYVLQHANTKTLNKSPFEVRRNFVNNLSKTHSSYTFLDKLKTYDQALQLNRIRYLRDFAHKWTIHPYQLEHAGSEVTVICIDNYDKREPKLPEQINIDRNDYWFMEQLFNDLDNSAFFD